MSVKPGRVSFIQSLLADPEKKKALMVNSIITTQAREGIVTTREQAEAAYAKAQSRPNSSRIAASPVSPRRKPAVEISEPESHGIRTRPIRDRADDGEDRSQTAAAVHGGVKQSGMAGSEGRLERIQQVTGVLRAYDGHYCIWGTNGPFDVRDVACRIGLSAHDVIDTLPDFTPVKRGRASVTPVEDSTG